MSDSGKSRKGEINQNEEKELSKDIPEPEEIEDTATILEEEQEQEAKAKLKELEELLAEREAEYQNALKYQMAEFENYKRRTEKEKREFADSRLEYFIKDLLPIKDGLEVAIEHTHTHTPVLAEEKTNSEGLVKGLEITVKQISELLEREGLEEIKATGEPFDPFRHEIIVKEKAKDEEHPENTVIDVMRKGYLFRGRVIRPAMVKIAIDENNAE